MEIQMTIRNKHHPKPARKRQAKTVLHALFHGWHDDTPEQLEKRVDFLRHLALCYRYNDREWRELHKMRDRMRTNVKFAGAA
jgi:hypothetical protein